MNFFTKHKQTHKHREQTYGCRGGKWREGIYRELGINTRLYLKWITKKVLLHSTGNSIQFYAAAWMGQKFGEEWIHVYVCALCPALCNPIHCKPTRLLCPSDSPGQNTGVGCHFLLQWIFPTQGSSPDLLHCRKILYCLSHQRSPTFNICVLKAELSLVCRTWLGVVLFLFFQ